MVSLMTKRTKKVGIAGKYAARYGVRVRKRMADVETARTQKYACPRCLMVSVKRTSSGIWQCRKCSLTFAGGAYVPTITEGITREIEAQETQAQEVPAKAEKKGAKKAAPAEEEEIRE